MKLTVVSVLLRPESVGTWEWVSSPLAQNWEASGLVSDRRPRGSGLSVGARGSIQLPAAHGRARVDWLFQATGRPPH